MFNIASLLQAISLCGIGGLLAYFRHADIEQLEQQWRRKTLPQYPQDTTSEDPPGDIEISEEVQDTSIPSYNVYEVYDHRKQVHDRIADILPTQLNSMNATFLECYITDPHQVVASTESTWLLPYTSLSLSAFSLSIVLASIACFFAGCVFGLCIRRFLRLKRRSVRLQNLRARQLAWEPRVPPVHIGMDEKQYQAIMEKLERLEVMIGIVQQKVDAQYPVVEPHSCNSEQHSQIIQDNSVSIPPHTGSPATTEPATDAPDDAQTGPDDASDDAPLDDQASVSNETTSSTSEIAHAEGVHVPLPPSLEGSYEMIPEAAEEEQSS